MQEKAWVAGASGYTGGWLVRHLLAAGIPTVAHLRPDSPSLATWQNTSELAAATLDTTAWQPEALLASLLRHQPSMVFVLLGTTRARARSQGLRPAQAYRHIDRDLALMLIDAASRASQSMPPPRVVYLSMIGLRQSSRNPYVQARVQVEKALQHSDLPYTIVRPAFITGPDRHENRPAERWTAKAFDGLLAAAASLGGKQLQARYASIDGQHLASFLLRAARDTNAAGRTLDLSDARLQ